MDFSVEAQLAEIARILAQAKEDAKLTEDFYIMKRRHQGAVTTSGPPPSTTSSPATAGTPPPQVEFSAEGATQKTKDNIRAFLEVVVGLPKDTFTFPEISRILEEKGRKLTPDQLRSIWSYTNDKKVYLCQLGSGRRAALYTRVKSDAAAPKQQEPVPGEEKFDGLIPNK